MIKTYVKTGFRKLSKNKFFTILNLIALTLSMSVSLVVIYVISNQYNYDDANVIKDEIYRINTSIKDKEGTVVKYATTPPAIGSSLDSLYFRKFVNLVPQRLKKIVYDNDSFFLSGALTNSDFFQIFPYPTVAGSLEKCLDGPNNMVLSKTTAEKLSNGDSMIGKTLTIENLGEYIVTAIFDDTKYKSHISNDFLLSNLALPFLIKKSKIDRSIENFDSYYSSYSYVLIPEQAEKGDLLKKLQQITKSYTEQYEFKSLRFTLRTPFWCTCIAHPFLFLWDCIKYLSCWVTLDIIAYSHKIP